MGLKVVRDAIAELEVNQRHWDQWQKFFRAQMAYLLLWSILERLSALCFGPNHDPMKRINQLHELRGIKELMLKHIERDDKVTDSRDPTAIYKLDRSNSEACFKYYYQVRNNLSHRGKAVRNEFDKVAKSLSELTTITEAYLLNLHDTERNS